MEDLGELPGQVDGVLYARVEALAALRRMYVGGVAGQQNTAAAVGYRLARHVRKPGDPARPAKPEVRAVHGDEGVAKLVQRGLAGVVEVGFGQDDPNRLAGLPSTDGVGADAVAAKAELRLFVHLDLGDEPTGRRVQPGEVDAGGLAGSAASSVTADQILRSQGGVIGELDVDPGVVLSEADHLAAAKYGNAELVDPLRQDSLDVILPQPEHVVVAGGKVGDAQGNQRKQHRRMRLPRRHEAVGDATLVEHLEAAGVQPPGA